MGERSSGGDETTGARELLATLGASLFVATPGLILIGKDLKLARRLRLLERRIAEVYEEALEGPNDDRRLTGRPGLR